MKDILNLFSNPAIAVFLIPIVAILGFAVNQGLKNYYAHKERLARIQRGELVESEMD